MGAMERVPFLEARPDVVKRWVLRCVAWRAIAWGVQPHCA